MAKKKKPLKKKPVPKKTPPASIKRAADGSFYFDVGK